MQNGAPESGQTRPAAHRNVLLLGLMLGVLLSALDQTIVGTSLPKIIASIGGFEHIAWVFTSYMLASVVMIPVTARPPPVSERAHSSHRAFSTFTASLLRTSTSA